MTEKAETKTYGFATRAVHVGNGVDQDSGAIKRPITMANSYALPYDPTDMNWSSAGANLYTRNGGTRLQAVSYPTDHFFADYRLTVAAVVSRYLKELCGRVFFGWILFPRKNSRENRPFSIDKRHSPSYNHINLCERLVFP